MTVILSVLNGDLPLTLCRSCLRRPVSWRWWRPQRPEYPACREDCWRHRCPWASSSGPWKAEIHCKYNDILSSVCLRISQFSQLYFMQYMGLCVFSWPISLMMIVRICVLLIIIKSEVWPICHCSGLGHETMVCTVCLSIPLWQYYMETVSALLVLCEGNLRSAVWIPSTKGQ